MKAILARSGDRRERTLEVGGYRHFPRETMRMDLLLAAPKTQSDLVCSNGVQFYDVTDSAAQSRRAAWSYEAPRTGMQQVDQLDQLLGRTSRSSDRDPRNIRPTWPNQ